MKEIQKTNEKEKDMEVRDFNYFANTQQGTNPRRAVDKLTDQDFDLDLQTVDRGSYGGPAVQGGSGFFCEITKESVCTHCCVATVTPCC